MANMRVLLFGATGTIGQATCQALLKAGHEVVCFARRKSGSQETVQPLAEFRVGDVMSLESLKRNGFKDEHFDAVVSCMASRTGAPKDAWAVDYQAHSHILQLAKESGVSQFVLLSAICVQKPLLAFQQAKLAFEKELMASGLVYSIVRPTAFFKSLSGQIKRLQQNKPFLLFGDGRLTACKPISDHDLGEFIAQCLTDASMQNQILPIGGPGEAITPLQQGEYLFNALGKTPAYKHVPVGFLDLIIQVLSVLGGFIPPLADKAELARIGRYYATESMLVWDTQAQRYDAQATPSYGSQTLFSYYDQLLMGQQSVHLGDHSVF
jgi:divinyl chlorophyllide a 8-vinyl-reductase